MGKYLNPNNLIIIVYAIYTQYYVCLKLNLKYN